MLFYNNKNNFFILIPSNLNNKYIKNIISFNNNNTPMFYHNENVL